MQVVLGRPDSQVPQGTSYCFHSSLQQTSERDHLRWIFRSPCHNMQHPLPFFRFCPINLPPYLQPTPFADYLLLDHLRGSSSTQPRAQSSVQSIKADFRERQAWRDVGAPYQWDCRRTRISVQYGGVAHVAHEKARHQAHCARRYARSATAGWISVLASANAVLGRSGGGGRRLNPPSSSGTVTEVPMRRNWLCSASSRARRSCAKYSARLRRGELL